MIGTLPSHWSALPIGSLCEINPKRDDLNDETLVTFLPMSSVEPGTGRINASASLPFGQLRKKSFRPFRERDVLFAKITPCMENGKCAIARNLSGGYGFGSTEFHVLRPGSGIISEYLMYFLLQPSFRAKAAKQMTGTAGQLRVPTSFLQQELIPVPSISEQQRILEIIEEQFSRLDAAEALLRGNSSRVALMIKGVFASQTRVFEAPELHKEKPDVPIPDGWHWVRAIDACEAIDSGSTPKADKMQSGFGEVPFLKVYNISTSSSIDFSIKPTFIDAQLHEGQLKRSRVTPGDVLMNIVGPPLGKVAIVPDSHPTWNINQAIVAFRPKRMLDSRFLANCLMSDAVLRPLLRTGKATAGQTNLALSNARKMWLPIPSLSAQVELVSDIERQVSRCTSLSSSLISSSKHSTALRRAILEQAFCGGLTRRSNSQAINFELERPI